MIPYKLDFTIEKTLENKNARSFSKTAITKKIKDHKWYLSERLGRDVGFAVAVFDYFINIQKLPTTPKTAS